MISAQMATCTAGKQVSIIGPEAQVALNAAATRCASTTPWPLRLPRWQLNGTMKQMTAPLRTWWHKAIQLLAGAATSLASHGQQELNPGSAKRNQAVRSVLIVGRPRSGSSTQTLQSVRTLTSKLSRQSGTMSTIHWSGFPHQKFSEKPQADLLALSQVPSRAGAQLVRFTL